MRPSLFAAICAVSTTIAAPAAATLIDFSSGVYSTDGVVQTYAEDGYSFTTPPGNHFDSNTFPGNPIVPGVPYLVFHEAASNPVNNLITLDFGGAAFDLLSFDLIFDTPILAFNPIINPPMTVTGSGGQSLVTPLGAAPGFVGTVPVNFLNVTSVTFDINLNSTVAGNVLLDNVMVQAAGTPPPAIPLPGAGGLLLAGLAALGFRARRSG